MLSLGIHCYERVCVDLERFKGTGPPLTGTPGEDDRTLRWCGCHSIQTGALAAPACQEGTVRGWLDQAMELRVMRRGV